MQYLLLILIAFLFFYLKYKAKTIDNNKKEKSIILYKKNYFFTKNENLFYRTLVEVLKNENVVIFSKVRMVDVIEIPRKQENFMHYFNKMKAKHIDFLICDKEFFEPIYCIELDDKSHLQEKRVERDILVNEMFKKAGMPLIRIPAMKEYTVNEIKHLLSEYIFKEDNTY